MGLVWWTQSVDLNEVLHCTHVNFSDHCAVPEKSRIVLICEIDCVHCKP